MICMKHNSKMQLLDPSSVPSRKTTTPSDEDAKRMSSHYQTRVLIWDQLVVQEQLLLWRYETSEGSSHHTQLVVPRSQRNSVLTDLHGGAMSGHLGKGKTQNRL